MRHYLIAVACAIAGSAYAAGPAHYQIRNASDLVQVCSTPQSASDHATAIAFCHGVLVGAYQYYDATTPAAERFVCAPDPVPTRTVIANGFVAWAKARPQLMNGHAVDTLFRFAGETYPCKK